jgi:hypothetical protein
MSLNHYCYDRPKQVITPKAYHYGKIVCAECGRHLKWIRTPLAIRRERRMEAKRAKRVLVWLPSPKEIELNKTAKGGWTRITLESWGVPWPPRKGWKKELEEKFRKSSSEEISHNWQKHIKVDTELCKIGHPSAF